MRGGERRREERRGRLVKKRGFDGEERVSWRGAGRGGGVERRGFS